MSTELGSKLEAKLEGNTEQLAYMDKLYHQYHSPNAYEIAFFMITSWHWWDRHTAGPTAMSLRPTYLSIRISYYIFGTVGFPYLIMVHAVRLKWSSFLNSSNILWSWVRH